MTVSGLASDTEPVSIVYYSDDGTLYAFIGDTGNTISAMDPNGNLKWNYDVSSQWRVLNPFAVKLYDPSNYDVAGPGGPIPAYFNFEGTITKPVFATDNGVLYLYVRENKTTSWNYEPASDHPIQPESGDWMLKEDLLAISPEGKLLWDVPISDVHHVYDDASVIAKNGRIYVYEDYNVTVMDTNGSELFKIPDVAGRPSVDESGYIYTVPGVILDPQPSDLTDYFKDYGYRNPANAVEAHYPNGTLYWHKDLDTQVIRMGYCSLPLYQNGTLWVPVVNGVWAMNPDGSVRWEKQYDGYTALYRTLPLDSNDNVYVVQYPQTGWESYHIISSEGVDTVRTASQQDPSINNAGMATNADASDGTLYCDENYISNVESQHQVTLDTMPSSNVIAYNLIDDRVLWNYTIVPNVKEIVVTSDNGGKLLSNELLLHRNYTDPNIYMDWSRDEGSENPVNILPGNGVVYVTYQAANFEMPLVLNQSKCGYFSEIYAFDKNNGTLLWEKSSDSLVSSATVNNSTIYYGTRDGKIIAQQLGGVVGGIAAVAASYLFIKFFLLGAVARARDRLNRNENRTSVLAYISENPGSNLGEVSKGLHMNLGTTRYHMIILALNHRVISYMADDKHIRYFINSNSYTKEDRFIISLMRRNCMRNILALLMDKPGITNAELSSSLGLKVSATSRYMKELSKKGIVTRMPQAGGTCAYSINDDQYEHIAAMIKRMNNI